MSTANPTPHDAIRTLYCDHHGWLQGWLRRRLGCSQQAADLAQDVFTRLLQRRQTVQARQPRALLSTIARGLVVEHWRRRELELAWLATLAALPEGEEPSPESRLLVIEALVAIDRMLDTLKPNIRSAFLLAQLDGMTCPQIAERLGVSLATVERYIARALRACYTLQFEA